MLLLRYFLASILLINSVCAAPLDVLYIQGGFGMGYAKQIKGKASGLKLNSERNNLFLFGVGYYLMENMRIGGQFVQHRDTTLKKTGNSPVFGGRGVSEKYKATINSIFFGGAVDLMDVSIATIFVNGGVGLSQIKEKINLIAGETIKNFPKSKTNLSYTLGAGASSEVAVGVHLDLAANWSFFGSSKSSFMQGKQVGKNNYSTLDTTLSVCYDL